MSERRSEEEAMIYLCHLGEDYEELALSPSLIVSYNSFL